MHHITVARHLVSFDLSDLLAQTFNCVLSIRCLVAQVVDSFLCLAFEVAVFFALAMKIVVDVVVLIA